MKISITNLIKNGRFNFELFVQHMTTTGYITEYDQIDGISMGSCMMETTRNDEIHRLYEFFYEGNKCPLKMNCTAVEDIYNRGAFYYAYFNENIISRTNTNAALAKRIKQFSSEHPDWVQ